MNNMNYERFNNETQELGRWCEEHSCFLSVHKDKFGVEYCSVFGDHECNAHERNLVLPNGIDEVSDGAFIGGSWDYLESITLPVSIKCVEKGAFRYKTIIKCPFNMDQKVIRSLINYGYTVDIINPKNIIANINDIIKAIDSVSGIPTSDAINKYYKTYTINIADQFIDRLDSNDIHYCFGHNVYTKHVKRRLKKRLSDLVSPNISINILCDTIVSFLNSVSDIILVVDRATKLKDSIEARRLKYSIPKADTEDYKMEYKVAVATEKAPSGIAQTIGKDAAEIEALNRKFNSLVVSLHI